MNPDTVIDLVTEMLWLAANLSLPILGAGLAVGLTVSVIQAATQIQESALSFVPKMLAVGGALVFAAPTMIETITRFTTILLLEIANLGPGV
ncbi:MAG: flagellar biosynthetic protein FliQ [Myxococcota bacterium]